MEFLARACNTLSLTAHLLPGPKGKWVGVGLLEGVHEGAVYYKD